MWSHAHSLYLHEFTKKYIPNKIKQIDNELNVPKIQILVNLLRG